MAQIGGQSTEAAGDSWKQAKTYASVLGLVPTSFSSAIRIMISDHQKFDAALRPVTKYQVSRLMQGPSFKSMLYHASLELRGGYIKDTPVLNVGGMIDLFDAFDVAAMVGNYLIFRKWKKFIGEQEWNWLLGNFSQESQISAQIGVAIPELGLGSSLMVGTIPYLALGTILKTNKPVVQKYLESRKQRAWDEPMQIKNFGCSLNQIATQLLCALGFGVEVASDYCSAMDPDRFFRPEDKGFLPNMQMSRLWLEALLGGREQPVHKIPGKFFPMATARTEMDTKIVEIKANRVHWLARGKDDISPTLTPRLFAKVEDKNQEVPDELKQVFSMEEIAKMEVDEFDQLIDQLDFENGGKAPPGMVVMSAKDLKDLDKMVE